ncbi:DUF4082 domain-containing protein [Cyclobacterium jeungdonense]|uniref:DUF4082 domain-containing protein n=1 Tax=Cyclobacterium jeungdonense TaxID=708087 RepID=A0ABT8CAQ3_9BACT|nr:DUF4082 domain-containing protein [Cyclobacterium jeungdonense]MDN3688878.1 DUF4082 domain-containing protein [Cyclobacterium jeungdonense]
MNKKSAYLSPLFVNKCLINAFQKGFKTVSSVTFPKGMRGWRIHMIFLFLFSIALTDILAQSVTLFSSSAAPNGSLQNEGQGVQLGMKFRASVSGSVTGARFYKQSGNNGTHTGQLYSNSGTLLASATFVNETASGWQEVAFDAPIAVTAGTTYVISYHSSEGYYSVDDYGFDQAIVNEPLTGLQNGTDGPNGMYQYSNTATFPTANYLSSNYYVDVVFIPDEGPGNQLPVISLTAPSNNATFTAPADISLVADASDPDGTVSKVEFFQGTTKLGEDIDGSDGWSYVWNSVAAGTYGLTAKATDDLGAVATSVAITVTVNIAPGDIFCPCTVFQATDAPENSLWNDGGPLQVGMKFQASSNGYVTAARFYKQSGNSGTHTGQLYSSSGTLLAEAVFTSETASGWQEVPFPSPVAITAGTTYVISYHSSEGFYSGTNPYFNEAITNGPLSGLASGTDGGNGVYIYSSTPAFPNNNFQSSNYWVDVVYQTDGNQAPTVTITAPADNASFTAPTDLTIEAAATDTDGSVTKVEFFQGTSKLGEDIDGSNGWSYLWSSVAAGNYQLTAKATDDQGGVSSSAVVNITVNASPGDFSCPCSLFQPTHLPGNSLWSDGLPIQLGMKFQASTDGYITSVRFYKQIGNTGTHTGQLFSSTGTLLASAIFDNETASGWQEVSFPSPVAISAGTTYIISYHSSAGYYSSDNPYFNEAITNGPLSGIVSGSEGGNGVYRYTSSPSFPNNNFQSSNYWVDVVFNTEIGPDETSPVVISSSPLNEATQVDETANVNVSFSEAIDLNTLSDVTFQLLDGGSPVTASITYDIANHTATLNPSISLNYSTTYTGRIKGGETDPRIKDLAGNALVADFEWSFTTRPSPPLAPGPSLPITEGPGGPILVISSTTNPFSRYPVEILRAEGLNEFAAKDISEVNSSILSGYDVVLLGEFPLQDTHVTLFTDWVTAGGTLIAFRPDSKLTSLLGITKVNGTLTDEYLLVNTSNGPGVGIVDQTIQFMGTADLYNLNGATSVAVLYSDVKTATTHPAVTRNDVGTNGGKAIAFTYDLARSIVYTRQGNPPWAGQKRSGTSGPIRSNDIYHPDWVDLNKVAIPQADEQQRLLANIIIQGNLHKKPLPRFWYLPRGLKAAIIMTGDDHATGGTVGRFNQYKSLSPSNTSQAVADWTAIRGTSYLWSSTNITDAEAAAFEAEGFEIALHLNTNCADWTPTLWRDFYNTQAQQLAVKLPSIASPTTHRTHCIAWSDWVNQAKVQSEYGIRLDANYYYWPEAWVQDRPGMFTGSGMPMRFADMDGTLIDSYQVATQITDESGQTYTTHINTLLDNALGPNGYYGAFCANMHTDQVNSTGSDVIIASALERQVPVISSKQMLTWLDGRNNSSFDSITWNENTLNFKITAASGSNNLRAMLPSLLEAGAIFSVTKDGNSVPFTTETIKGIEYVFFPAISGAYEASYGTLANARIRSENAEADSTSSNEVEKRKDAFSFRVYPNPSKRDGFQLEAAGLESQEDVKLVLYNQIGGVETSRIEKADEWGNIVIRFELDHNFSAGIYILLMQSKADIIRHKIIITR